jgi:hypothetical protein
MKTFLEFINEPKLPFLDEVFIVGEDGRHYERLDEGKWISGRFPSNIRLDHPTHGAGQLHGHVHGRKGEELVIVNVDGTGSHGTKGKLHDLDAEALRSRGFSIRPDKIVEWIVLDVRAKLLLG